CCGQPPLPPCLTLLDLARALQAIGHFGGASSVFNFNLPRTAIAQSFPVAAVVQLVGGPVHFLLVIGFDDVAGSVDVIDPASGVMSTVAFPTLFSNPRWTWNGWFMTQ